MITNQRLRSISNIFYVTEPIIHSFYVTNLFTDKRKTIKTFPSYAMTFHILIIRKFQRSPWKNSRPAVLMILQDYQRS